MRTQRELILEAVEALETLLGQGVGEQLEVLLQSPTHPPASSTELERAQQLTSLLGHRNRVEKKKGWDDLGWTRPKPLWPRRRLVQHEGLEGVVNQIDARHRADDARRKRRQSNGVGVNEGMEGVLVEEADSSEEVGVKVEAGKKWKVRKGRFGGGSGSAGGIDVDRLLQILHGLSKEDQDLFKRDVGKHGGSDVSSVEDGLTEVPARVEDLAETPCS